jgi:hypothetical protein
MTCWSKCRPLNGSVTAAAIFAIMAMRLMPATLHRTAAVTISGIELAAKIRKHQFKVGKLPGRPVTIPAIWLAPRVSGSTVLKNDDQLTRPPGYIYFLFPRRFSAVSRHTYKPAE